MTKYLVTGASGQLGQLVIAHLQTLVAKEDIVALVRTDEQSAAYTAQGIETRLGDYDKPDTLTAAFDGIDRLLLISSSMIGQRLSQHSNVISAAKETGVSFIAYTSLLRAGTTPMALAEEHKATEEILASSGIAHTILRNGWYSENITMGVQQDITLGQHFGAAEDGKFSTASRQDYAEAAAIVLKGGHDGEVLELAGDDAFTLSDFAALVTEASGKPVSYTNMPKDAFTAALVGAGLPEGFAAILADSDANAANGHLFNDSKTLSSLIGRPTTPLAETLKTVLENV